jgi:ABC-2 type transport system ATP-binding protein/lipopolysaccharide transport system ATP-binding protein
VIISTNVTPLVDLGAGLEDGVNGFDNIQLSAKLQRIPRNRLAAFSSYVQAFSELGEALSRPVRTYSSGMTLRLSFALRTFTKPDILVLDEVFGVGDHNFSIKAKARTTELLQAASCLLLASHDANLIREFCTLALWLEWGRVKAFGSVDDVLAQYESTA